MWHFVGEICGILSERFVAFYRRDLWNPLNEGNPSLNEGNPSLNEGNPSLNEGNPSLNEGNPSLNEGNPSLNEGNPPLNEGNPSLNEGNLRKEVISNELLSKADEKIYSLIKDDNTISIKDISEKLGLSHSTVKRAIKKLKTLGYVKRIGTTRGTWKSKGGISPAPVWIFA